MVNATIGGCADSVWDVFLNLQEPLVCASPCLFRWSGALVKATRLEAKAETAAKFVSFVQLLAHQPSVRYAVRCVLLA